MGKVIAFFSKWAFAIVLGVVAIALLFALGCTIYTAIANAFVGITGMVGVCIAIALVIGFLTKEIKEGGGW